VNLQYLFLFLATVFAVSLPWTIRNAAVYGEAVPIALEANHYIRPVTGWIGAGVEADDGGDADDRRVMRAHPGGVVQNTIEFWRVTRLRGSGGDADRGVHAESAWSLRHNLINILTFGVLLPFAVVGVVFAWRRRNAAALVLVAVTLVYYGMRAVIGATERSRLPIEPMVILLAMYGLTELVRTLRAGRAPEAADTG
jgi:hypothetical protein